MFASNLNLNKWCWKILLLRTIWHHWEILDLVKGDVGRQFLWSLVRIASCFIDSSSPYCDGISSKYYQEKKQEAAKRPSVRAIAPNFAMFMLLDFNCLISH